MDWLTCKVEGCRRWTLFRGHRPYCGPSHALVGSFQEAGVWASFERGFWAVGRARRK